MPAVLRIFGERATDDVIEMVRSERLDGGDGSGLFFKDGRSDGELAFAFEGALAGESFIENGAQREESLEPQHVLTVQLFLAVMSIPVLCVAILIQERGAPWKRAFGRTKKH